MDRATESTFQRRRVSQKVVVVRLCRLAERLTVRHPARMAAAQDSAVLRPVAPGAPRSHTAALARYLRTRWGLGMFAANLAGAVDVFVLLRWILPTPSPPAGEDTLLRDAIAFVAFMAVSFPLGGWGTVRAARPVLDWLDRGGAPTDAQRRAALRLPARQTFLHAALWLVAAAFFAGLDAPVSGDLARYEAVTIVMGALTTCALTYLLAERVLRPVTALALAGKPPKQPVSPGVKGRLVLAWVTASGVPLVGLALVGVDVATRSDLTKSRIASSILVLSALAIAVGLAATIIAAKSVAEPVWSVRRALARV